MWVQWKCLVSTGLGLGQSADDIRISGIGDAECAHTEILSAGCAELDVVAIVVMDSSLGQHSVVFDLRFSNYVKRKCFRLNGKVVQCWDMLAILESFVSSEKCRELLHRVSNRTHTSQSYERLHMVPWEFMWIVRFEVWRFVETIYFAVIVRSWW